MPLPLSAIVSALKGLSRSPVEYVEVSVPADCGVKVKVTVQLACGARMPLQLSL